MAVIEVVKGGQKIENVVITTPQPMTPTGALPPDIGYVEIGTSEDRGSIWMTGQGPPTTDAGQAGDMYLDMDTGDVWQWNGTEWELQGTFAPSTDTPEEVLAKIITVDGPGSLLDADTLDGHDSTYFATASGLALAESDIDVLEAEVDAVAAENDQQDIDISMKANIASPLFTGDPRAPTPPTADNDTSIATTAYVKANIATIPPNDWASIPGKPATFPPTVPIAQADVTNLVSDLALKAPLASPTFTGDPKAPTPATSDNDTSIATTAFVKAVTGAIVGGALISDTPPASPAVGQMWFESDSGNTFIWYNDGDSAQWVQVNIQPAIATNPNAGQTAQTRNRLINGGMQISQENGNTGGTANGYYPADQWLSGYASSSTITAQRGVGVTGAPAQPFIALFAAPAETAAAAAEYISFTHRIEGIRVSDFNFGHATASVQAVIAFDVNVPVAGTYWVSLVNSPATHTYLASYTISAGEAATWVRKSVVIPAGAINAGTWTTDTSAGAILRFCVHAGSTYVGVAGFQSGTLYAGPGQALGLSTAAGCYLTRVGLYLDPLNTGLPPRWELPDEAQELISCKRYWQTITMRLGGYIQAGIGPDYLSLLPVSMRVTPAVTSYNIGNTTVTGTAISAWNNSVTRLTSSGSGTGGFISSADGNLNARM